MAVASLQAALLKKIYAPLVNPLAPPKSLAAKIKFVERSKRNGLSYDFPLRMALEQGFTFNLDHSAYALNEAVDGEYVTATLDGAEITGRSKFSYGAMSKLSTEKGDSAKAYDQEFAQRMVSLAESADQKRELQLLYGSGSAGLSNLGQVSGIAVAAAGALVTVNISRASYIPGFWQDARNAQLDAFTTGGTHRNPTTALTVVAVDRNRARIQLQGANAEVAAIAANDVLFFRGARALSAVGMQAILENTGTLFGISAATYPQWQGVQYAVGGPLSFDNIVDAVTQIMDNGYDEGQVDFLMPQRAWADAMKDEAALRRYTNGGQTTTAKPGFEKLEFVVGGVNVNVSTHRYLKQSLAFCIVADEWHRIGSSDIAFTVPGNKDEFFFDQLPNANGVEIRNYQDQALVCELPYHGVILSGIQSTSDIIPS